MARRVVWLFWDVEVVVFLHIDIDSFFVSAERTIDPSLKGVAMAVGSRSNLEIFDKKRTHTRLIDDNSGAFVAPVFYSDKKRSFESYFVDKVDNRRKIRGIITTSSYEAREFGVKTAMPIALALQICPDMVVVPANYPLYHRLSHKIHNFMMLHIPQVEQYSIDEFFCDVSGWVEDKDVVAFSRRLQSQVMEEFDIPVSIGISKAKWIAKLATESAKPFGVYEVQDIDAYINDIPIKAFPGIGRGFEQKLLKHYIKTLGQIKSRKRLFYSWGKPGISLYHRVLGSDSEGIESRGERKSIGISRTFDPIGNGGEIKRRIMIMARHVSYMSAAIGVSPATFYLKIDYEYGVKVKKTVTINRIFSEQLLKKSLTLMCNEIAIANKRAVKLTINISNFVSHHHKTVSMLELDSDIKNHKLSNEINRLRDRFGLDILKTADEL